MIKQELFGSMVEIDLEATKEWYNRGNEWGCECAHCRNFLELARNKQIPQQIIELLWRALVFARNRLPMSVSFTTMTRGTTTNSAIA